MATFTLANQTDINGGTTQVSTTPFTQSLFANTLLVTVAGAASVVLLSALYLPGQSVTVVDAASFAGRASSPITITVAGPGTIDAGANKMITSPGGAFRLMFISGTAWQTVAHNP